MIELADEIGREHVEVLEAMSRQQEQDFYYQDFYYQDAFQCVAHKNADEYDIPLEHPGNGYSCDDADNPYQGSHPLHQFWRDPWIGAPANVVSKLESRSASSLRSFAANRNAEAPTISGPWRRKRSRSRTAAGISSRANIWWRACAGTVRARTRASSWDGQFLVP